MKRALPPFFILTGALLCIVGWAAIGAGFFLRDNNTLPNGMTWTSPLEQIDPRALAPGTLWLPLSGVSSADALNLTLNSGHWENAYALVAFDPSLADTTRIGALLQLGGRWGAKHKARAAWSYLAAARLATINPVIADLIRIDTYLQASAGLSELDARGAARLLTDQAYVVALHSPALPRETRARELTQVAKSYDALGQSSLANDARRDAGELMKGQGENVVQAPREPFMVLQVELPASKELENAITTRVAAAKQLIDDAAATSAKTVTEMPADSLQQLRDALLAEDRVRLDYYDKQLKQTPEPGGRVALLRDKVWWLAIKYRVARGGFGANLVPEWSKQASDISSAWSDAWGDLFRVLESQAAGTPQAKTVAMATETVLRQELYALRWGWYRGTTEAELRSALDDVNGKLRRQPVPGLRLDLLTTQSQSIDWLVPDELYGKNADARPK